MGVLPEERSERVFADFKPPYDGAQAVAEANRCLYCADAPCTKACPTGINVPEFIRKIATNNLKGSARTIFSANILGTSCARVCPVEVLCVGDCVYNHMGQPPIQIGKLQRYATDNAMAHGWRFFQAGRDTGKHVALVGAGPASLAAAHELRRHGHACTIYEKGKYPGGLNTTGVAPYKMRSERAVEEAAWILGIGGIEVKSGVVVGKDVSWAELEKKHDAIFVGLGLGADSKLGVPGEDLPGVEGAVAFIERFKLGTVDLSHVRRAAVVGGGNTAIDAVRELLGLGVPEVALVYRGDEAAMSGYAHEWKAARTESARAYFRTLPVAFTGASRVSSMRCVQLDAKKQPIAGTEHELPVDLVLMAIGQAKLGELLRGLDGVRVERGRILVDEHGFTGRKGYWAGGDCANGGKEVVNAAHEGKLAAQAIDAFLNGSVAKGSARG